MAQPPTMAFTRAIGWMEGMAADMQAPHRQWRSGQYRHGEEEALVGDNPTGGSAYDEEAYGRADGLHGENGYSRYVRAVKMFFLCS